MSMPQLTVETFLVLTSVTTNCRVQNPLHSHQSPSASLKQFKLQRSQNHTSENLLLLSSCMHKYNQTIHTCSRKIFGVACSFGFCKSSSPEVMHTNHYPEKSTYATERKNYASVFLCNNIPQKKQGLSGRQRTWLALKTMLKVGTVKFPLPDPSSSSQALHWKICSLACHRNGKGGWHPKIIPLTQQQPSSVWYRVNEIKEKGLFPLVYDSKDLT